MADAPLRAVKDGEKPAKDEDCDPEDRDQWSQANPSYPHRTTDAAMARKQTVSQAAASGDYRALLVSTRDRIARTIDNPDCPPRDLAALTRRLTDIGKELEAIDARDADGSEDGGVRTDDDAWEAV